MIENTRKMRYMGSNSEGIHTTARFLSVDGEYEDSLYVVSQEQSDLLDVNKMYQITVTIKEAV